MRPGASKEKPGPAWRLVGALVLLALECLATAAPAHAVVPSKEFICRKTLVTQTRSYLYFAHRVRRQCLRRIHRGATSPLVDCIEGDGDARVARKLGPARTELGVQLARKCTGVDFTTMKFPGRCESAGESFDVIDLELCVLSEVDQAVADMLRVESPPAEALPRGSIGCVATVSRRGEAQVRHEVHSRTDCLLAQDRSSVFDESLTCREALPPYSRGTSSERYDRKILKGYVGLLAGIPAACKLVKPDRLLFQEDCEDHTGGRFSTFDLKLCVFEHHRAVATDIVDLVFPSDPVCGDGDVEGDEACDDGNQAQTDECLNDCTVARCGDGFVHAGVEECDDANTSDGDGCVDECVLARCGDGLVHAGVEECDDADTNQSDPCLTNCKNARCGDGAVCSALTPERCDSGPEGAPEACDDSNTTDGDGCNAQCAIEFCGDGVSQPGLGEECDDGPSNSDTQPDACRADCNAPSCGDEVVDSGESCDPPDGTTCDPQCRPLLCGNGDLDEGEECDNGAANSNTAPDACRTICRLPSCGDSVTDPSNDEACDDGNTSNTDACLGTCVANTCGDGFHNPSAEECDDGNAANDDACVTGCKLNVCGDGARNPAEEACDDGNEDDGDPCRNDCIVAACGDGATCDATTCRTGPEGAAEECDDGASNSDTAPDACRLSCASPFCGDGVVDTGEACDDGASNGTTADGCSAECTLPTICTVLFRVTTAETLGALKYEVDFSAAPGNFAGTGLTVSCTNLLVGASSNFFEDEAGQKLRHSIISLGGFTTPSDLANCSFAATGTPTPAQFVITVTDASTPDLQPASPTVVSSVSCGAP